MTGRAHNVRPYGGNGGKQMANGLNNNIKAGLLSGGGFAAGPKKNTPTQLLQQSLSS